MVYSAMKGGLHGAVGAAAGSLAQAAKEAMAARDSGRSLDEQKRVFQEELEAAQRRAQHEDASKSDEQRVADAKETAAHAPRLADDRLQPRTADVKPEAKTSEPEAGEIAIVNPANRVPAAQPAPQQDAVDRLM